MLNKTPKEKETRLFWLPKYGELLSSFHTMPLVPKGKHEGQTERIKVLAFCGYPT
jgi:hypothetical protein